MNRQRIGNVRRKPRAIPANPGQKTTVQLTNKILSSLMLKLIKIKSFAHLWTLFTYLASTIPANVTQLLGELTFLNILSTCMIIIGIEEYASKGI